MTRPVELAFLRRVSVPRMGCLLALTLGGCALITEDRQQERLDPDGDGVDWPSDCDDADPEVGECTDATTTPSTTTTTTPSTSTTSTTSTTTTTSLPGLTLLPIASGSFTMGCTEGQGDECGDDEEPHEVTLTRSFWLGETEVTQGQFEDLMGYNPSDFNGCGDDCPVEYVSWHEAVAFANALSTVEGFELCYTCAGSGDEVECSPVGDEPYACEGCRLPTEAEWEYAGRCGTDLMYAGSDDIDEVAWYSDTEASSTPSTPGPHSDYHTHAVGELAANDCGLYDISGNVWEWLGDWYEEDYQSDSSVDPVGPQSGAGRVGHGGSWFSTPHYARLADRNWILRGYRNNNLGFRVLRTIP